MSAWMDGSIAIIQECRVMFDVKLVSDMILNRKRNFLTKFVNNCNNVVCNAIAILAKCELLTV